MLLTQILDSSVQHYAHKPALTMRIGYRTVTLTYIQVDTMARRVALLLEAHAVVKGEMVLLCAPNSPYWVCVWWGCLLRGCPVVPLAIQSTNSLIEKIAQQTQAKVFFTSAHLRFELNNCKNFLIEDLPSLVAPFDVERFCIQSLSDNDIAEIMYTSGTTGDPKGVVLTHENIASNVNDLRDVLHISGPRERLLSILPLSHMLEQTIGFLLPFAYGAHIVYAHSHGAIKELLQKYRVTKMVAVPEFLKLMMQRIQTGMKERNRESIFNVLHYCSSKVSFKPLQRIIMRPMLTLLGGKLDTIASGGAPLDPDVERWWDVCGIHILQGFGLTETSPVITTNLYEQHRLGSVGKPLAHVELRIGVQGEIEVRGPSVFHTYFKNEEKTLESFTNDGWFKTGDVGHVDDDGFLFLKGRKLYIIKGPGAQNIFPEDIETVLNAIAGVKDSCVVGLETSSGMIEVHAVLLLADSTVNVRSIIQRANSILEPYQRITGWSIWPHDDFERSVTRKIKKEKVLDWLREMKRGGAHVEGPVISGSYLIPVLAQISGVAMNQIHSGTSLLYDLKFDSLMRVELIMRIEELKGILIDERLITEQTTVADLEKIIATVRPVVTMPRAKQWPRAWWAHVLRYFGFVVMVVISRFFFKIKLEGAQNLKDVHGPVIVMPNHLSLIDGLVLMLALPRVIRKRLSFAAAYDMLYGEYWYVRWLAELFFNAFPFPRKEQEHVMTGLLNIGSMLDAGYSVVLFPEGQLSKTGQLQPFKRGAGLVAVDMGVPVVPIKIEGINKLVPYDCFIPRKRGNVVAKIGKPLLFDGGVAYDEAIETIADELHKL